MSSTRISGVLLYRVLNLDIWGSIISCLQPGYRGFILSCSQPGYLGFIISCPQPGYLGFYYIVSSTWISGVILYRVLNPDILGLLHRVLNLDIWGYIISCAEPGYLRLYYIVSSTRISGVYYFVSSTWISGVYYIVSSTWISGVISYRVLNLDIRGYVISCLQPGYLGVYYIVSSTWISGVLLYRVLYLDIWGYIISCLQPRYRKSILHFKPNQVLVSNIYFYHFKHFLNSKMILYKLLEKNASEQETNFKIFLFQNFKQLSSLTFYFSIDGFNVL